MESLVSLNEWLNDFLLSLGLIAPLFCCILIFLEGTLAFLPLFVFITINVLTLGPILGCLISWIFTVAGSFVNFMLSRKLFSGFVQRRVKKKKKLAKIMNAINKLKFSQLVLIIAIPFTPSFFINLGAGISKIPKVKYFYALLIAKIFIVVFWGYIGSNLIECLINPIEIIKVIVLVIIAYMFSKFVNKKFNIDERY